MKTEQLTKTLPVRKNSFNCFPGQKHFHSYFGKTEKIEKWKWSLGGFCFQFPGKVFRKNSLNIETQRNLILGKQMLLKIWIFSLALYWNYIKLSPMMTLAFLIPFIHNTLKKSQNFHEDAANFWHLKLCMYFEHQHCYSFW